MVEMLAESDDGFELLDRGDKRQYDNEKEKIDRRSSNVADYIRTWQQARERIHGPRPKIVSEGSSRAAKREAKRVGATIYPGRVPAGEISQPQLKLLCPPGGFVWTGHATGTWHCHFKPWPRASRSWHLCGGSRPAAVEILKFLWDRWCVTHGASHDDIPIIGIFDGEGE